MQRSAPIEGLRWPAGSTLEPRALLMGTIVVFVLIVALLGLRVL